MGTACEQDFTSCIYIAFYNHRQAGYKIRAVRVLRIYSHIYHNALSKNLTVVSVLFCSICQRIKGDEKKIEILILIFLHVTRESQGQKKIQ